MKTLFYLFITTIFSTTVLAYNGAHSGADVDQGVTNGNAIGALTGVIVSDGSDSFSVADLSDIPNEGVTARTVTTAGVDLETTDAGVLQVLTIAGLTDNRTVTLPAFTGSGNIYKIAIIDGDDTYDIRLDPDGTDQIIGTSAAGDYLGADDAGDYIEIVDIATGYGLQRAKAGTWTEE